MENCIFCQIAAGRIPSNKVYEDADFIVFMDIAPQTEGHCLVVSKEHFETLNEVPDHLLALALPLAKKIAAAAMAGLKADGCNLLQNNGAVAGQVVGHWHLHIIPRKDPAEIPMKPGAAADLTKLPFVAEKIRGGGRFN